MSLKCSFLIGEGKTCHCVHMKARCPHSRVNSLLPPCGIQGSNPGRQVYAKGPPPTEPSHQPNSLFSPLDSAYEEKKMPLFSFPIWLIWFIYLSGRIYFPEDAISPLTSEYTSAMSMCHICFIQHLLISSHVGAVSSLLQTMLQEMGLMCCPGFLQGCPEEWHNRITWPFYFSCLMNLHADFHVATLTSKWLH